MNEKRQTATAENLERAKAHQRMVNAYHLTFGTPEGQFVLKDLAKKFRLEGAVFNPVQKEGHHAYDPLTAALTDGGRGVVIFIKEILAQPFTGDGNITKPRNKVKR